MTRLLDSNVFITAKNTYYSFDVFPAFWAWLDDQAATGAIASTDMVYDELCQQNDPLADWARDRKQSMFHVESTTQAITARIADIGRWMNSVPFRSHVQEEFMDGADPFIAAAAAVRGDTVVSAETFDAQIRRKVKLPNACHALGVPYETTFQALTRLGARF